MGVIVKVEMYSPTRLSQMACYTIRQMCGSCVLQCVRSGGMFLLYIQDSFAR